ncbi:MAG: four helix bundle protein [Clostridia bacterium]|nr:four helix bundle protein [Clostridia bacterium]
MYDNDNVIATKSRNFAIRTIKLYQYLQQEKNEYTMSRQLLKCGTSIGANVKEALRGQSKADFAAKMNIALKEASETEYWLDILNATNYISNKEYKSINDDLLEISKLLTSIVKTSFNS